MRKAVNLHAVGRGRCQTRNGGKVKKLEKAGAALLLLLLANAAISIGVAAAQETPIYTSMK